MHRVSPLIQFHLLTLRRHTDDTAAAAAAAVSEIISYQRTQAVRVHLARCD